MRRNRELRPIAEFTVALPVQGFVHALGVLENARERFVEQALINPAGSQKGGSTPPAGKVTQFLVTGEAT